MLLLLVMRIFGLIQLSTGWNIINQLYPRVPMRQGDLAEAHQ